jgi:hypothetical protein
VSWLDDASSPVSSLRWHGRAQSSGSRLQNGDYDNTLNPRTAHEGTLKLREFRFNVYNIMVVYMPSAVVLKTPKHVFALYYLQNKQLLFLVEQ